MGVSVRSRFFAGKKFVVALLVSVLTICSVATTAHAADLAFTYAPYPSISSGSSVGSTLTASTGAWSPTPTSFTYQWTRDGYAITGATSSIYTVVGDDYGSYVSVIVTAYKTGYVTTTKDSYYYSRNYISGQANFSNVSQPTISGSAQVGETLSANVSGWDTGVKFSYQWYDDGYSIYGETGQTFFIRSYYKGSQISVKVTGTKKGYVTVTQTSLNTSAVLPAVPKVAWSPQYQLLTGKNTISVTGTQAYDSYSQLRTWCFTLDGSPFNLSNSSKGAYFVDSSGYTISVTSAGTGCFTSNNNLLNARIRIDVTNWTLGSHILGVKVTDNSGLSSLLTTTSIAVGKTAPVVNIDSYAIKPIIESDFTVTASSSTHSVSAPVRKWCLTIDGTPVETARGTFKSSTGSAVSVAFEGFGAGDGCFDAGQSGDIASATFTILSTQFANGTHDLQLRSQSGDSEGSTWWSDIAKTSVKFKNPYIPEVQWSSLMLKPTPKGQDVKIIASIKANIPGNPSSVVVSAETSEGEFSEITTVTNSSVISESYSFEANSRVILEIFDEDKKLVLTESYVVLVSPFVKLGKPKVVVMGSTISNATRKTVTYPVASSAGQNANCVLSWNASGKGTTKFNIKNGKASVVFRPNSRTGTVSVVCNAEGMTANIAVKGKF